MADTLIRRAKRNALFYYLHFFLYAALTFIISPALARGLGVHDYGLWRSIQKLLDFASIADGRTSQALKWVIAKQEGQHDDCAKQRAIGSALRVWVYFLPALALTTTLLVIATPTLVHVVAPQEDQYVRIVAIILGVNILLAPILGIPDAVLIGSNRGYLSLGTQAFWLLASNAAVYAAISFGARLPIFAAIITITGILNGISVYVVAKLTTPWFNAQAPSKDDLHQFTSFSAWVLLWTIVDRLLLSGETLLIGYLEGPESVTRYSFTAFVVQFALSMLLLANSAIAPGIGKLVGQNDPQRTAQVILPLREIIFFLATSFSCALILLNQLFITLWIGENYFLGNLSNFLIALLFLQAAAIRSNAQLHDLTLNISKRVKFGLLFSTLSIALPVLIHNTIISTIDGILISILAGRALLTWQTAKLTNSAFSITALPIITMLHSATAMSLSVLALNSSLNMAINTRSVFLSASTIAIVIYAYRYTLSPPTRAYFIARFRRTL